MANKIITFVIETLEPELDSVLAAAINELHSLGHKVKEVRVADDSGEAKVPVNTVAGVTVPAPVPQVTTPAPVAEAPEAAAPVPASEPDGDETPGQTHDGSGEPDADEPPVDVPPTA